MNEFFIGVEPTSAAFNKSVLEKSGAVQAVVKVFLKILYDDKLVQSQCDFNESNLNIIYNVLNCYC